MPTIDLAAPAPTPLPGPLPLLDALPRRVTLTLPELRHLATLAGGAPLPFDVPADATADPPEVSHALEHRFGASPATTDDAAYAVALATLREPEASLARRGLLETGAAAGPLGAVGLLATPTTALDLDVTAAGLRARSWHRRAGDAVAALSTVDGLVFELAWFSVDRWPDELGRAAVLPEDCAVTASGVPATLDLPFDLADAAAEAVRAGRADLLPVLAAQAEAEAVLSDGRPLVAADVPRALDALTTEARGRLRVLVADVSGADTAVVGVVSWTLLADGWHALRPRRSDDGRRVAVVAVEPADLARELAPVLAGVVA